MCVVNRPKIITARGKRRKRHLANGRFIGQNKSLDSEQIVLAGTQQSTAVPSASHGENIAEHHSEDQDTSQQLLNDLLYGSLTPEPSEGQQSTSLGISTDTPQILLNAIYGPLTPDSDRERAVERTPELLKLFDILVESLTWSDTTSILAEQDIGDLASSSSLFSTPIVIRLPSLVESVPNSPTPSEPSQNSPTPSETRSQPQSPVLTPPKDMEMAAAPTRRMPLRHDRDAPKFSGENPKEIKRFLEDVADLVDLCEREDATDERKIDRVKYYCVQGVEEKLETIKNERWAEFKTAAIKLYNGSTAVSDKGRFTRGTLVDLVTQRSMAGIPDSTAMLEYYRDFKTQVSHLALGEAEICDLFMKGLPYVVAERLRSRLERKYVDHHMVDPYTLDQLFESLEWLYNGGIAVLGGRGVGDNMGGGSGAVRAEGGGVVVKTEKTEYSAITEAIKSMNTMMAMIGQMGQQQLNYNNARVQSLPTLVPQVGVPILSTPMIRPMTVPGGFPPPPRPGCRFCDRADHYIRSCPVVDEYIAAGKCIRNAGGQVTLPNGAFLPRYAQGGSL